VRLGRLFVRPRTQYVELRAAQAFWGPGVFGMGVLVGDANPSHRGPSALALVPTVTAYQES